MAAPHESRMDEWKCVRRATLAKPMLIGEWADIGVLKDGEEYYLVHSSGWYRPGILIWHSKDLHTWRPLTYAVENFEGTIWLTDLVKVDGRYYILFLRDWDPGTGCHVLTADSMEGPWSEPTPPGLPPDAVFAGGDEGRRYLFTGGGDLTRLAPDRLAAAGETRNVYSGWPYPEDWAVEAYPCLEAPKIIRRDGWWHLMEAQGGTFGPSTSHMVVSARAPSPFGPWENSLHNPIIRTWSREEPWWSKGHGQLVEGPDGQWFCILHAIMNGYRSLGRCTVIEPIEWTEDGWFRVADRWPDGWEEPVKVEMPMSDEFDGDRLGIQWQFHREWDPGRFTVSDGALTLEGRGQDPGDSMPLTIQPMHRAYEIETALEVEGDATAGLMLFYSPQSYIGSGISRDGTVLRVQEGHKRYHWMVEPRIGRTRVELRIVNDKHDARFYYRDDAGRWRIVQPSMDVSVAVSTPWNLRPALFVCGRGRARFEHFRYRPLESAEDMNRSLEDQFRLSQQAPAQGGVALTKGNGGPE